MKIINGDKNATTYIECFLLNLFLKTGVPETGVNDIGDGFNSTSIFYVSNIVLNTSTYWLFSIFEVVLTSSDIEFGSKQFLHSYVVPRIFLSFFFFP